MDVEVHLLIKTDTTEWFLLQILMSANLCHVLMEELVITCLTNSRVIVLADMRVIYVKRVSIEGVTHTCTRRDCHGRDDNYI
jgi:hypothetical protein